MLNLHIVNIELLHNIFFSILTQYFFQYPFQPGFNRLVLFVIEHPLPIPLPYYYYYFLNKVDLTSFKERKGNNLQHP